MLEKFVTNISGLFQFICVSLVNKGDFNKAYYLFIFKHFIKYIRNKIRKKTIPNSFLMDQSNASIKGNINKHKKATEKERDIDYDSTNSDDTLKNKKIYLMMNRFQHTGEGIENDFARTWINTAQSVGINLRHFYLDDFYLDKIQFETDVYGIETDLRAFNPDYLIVHNNWWLDKSDREEKLAFLRQMKDKLGFKLIIILADSHSYGFEEEVHRFFDIADKIISPSSWTPLFSFEEFQSKLRPLQFFIDDNLFFPERKNIDMFFSGVEQPERGEIISFADFVASKLKLKTELYLRSGTNREVTTRKIMDDETYIGLLRKSRTAINISQKGTREKGKPIHIINGRVTEAIACGAALVQYKPKDDTTLTLDNYYTPWKEYLPFSSRKELKEILYLLKYEPDTISEIGHNGRQRYLECYNAAKGWEKLLKIPC